MEHVVEGTVSLAGARFDPLTRADVCDRIFDDLRRGRGGWVITMNVDHLQRFANDADIRRLCAGAELVVADGAPLLWAARLRNTPLPDRVAGSDLVWLLAERAAREGRSVYLLGGDPGVAAQAAAQFRARWPELEVAGTASPDVPAAPTERDLAGLRASLEATRPDLVYVALGAPKQERVISALRGNLPGTWWIGVGISLSFVSGGVRRAPGWMQRIGLEWLHRLAQEPRRLARRYLVDDLPFAFRLLWSSWRGRS